MLTRQVRPCVGEMFAPAANSYNFLFGGGFSAL